MENMFWLHSLRLRLTSKLCLCIQIYDELKINIILLVKYEYFLYASFSVYIDHLHREGDNILFLHVVHAPHSRKHTFHILDHLV